MTFRAGFLISSLFAASLPLAAMEVPVQRGASGSSKRGLSVAFVDMERIYQEFPETQKARKEYQEQAGKMKNVIADKEAELTDLRDQLSILRAAQQDASSAPLPSTASMTGLPAASTAVPSGAAIAAQLEGSLAEKEHMLAEQEDSLALARKEAAGALADFERRRAEQIFGKLYKSLVQLADEKGVDVVLDKSSLLYGQKGMDLTEALSRRVRGLPPEDEDR